MRKFLRGAVTARFVAKVAVTLVISGGVLWYYVGSLREKRKVAGKALQLGLGRSSGFHRGLPRRGDSGLLEAPGTEYAARDSRRREEAAQHPPACRRNQRAVYGARPSKLTEFQKTRYKDPVSGKPLEYSAKPPAGYTTCTIFDTGSPKEDADDAFAFWTYTAGHKCYDFEAGQAVPQVPYNYYY